MQVCTSLQTDNHASTPPLKCFSCPSCCPTNSVKALKANEGLLSWVKSVNIYSLSLLQVLIDTGEQRLASEHYVEFTDQFLDDRQQDGGRSHVARERRERSSNEDKNQNDDNCWQRAEHRQRWTEHLRQARHLHSHTTRVLSPAVGSLITAWVRYWYCMITCTGSTFPTGFSSRLECQNGRAPPTDVQSVNIGIQSARRKASDRTLWRRIVDKATHTHARTHTHTQTHI